MDAPQLPDRAVAAPALHERVVLLPARGLGDVPPRRMLAAHGRGACMTTSMMRIGQRPHGDMQKRGGRNIEPDTRLR